MSGKLFLKSGITTLSIGTSTMDILSFGKGTQALLILPGLSLGRVKDAVLPLKLMYRIFAKDFRVYIFDKIEHVPEGYTISQMARDTACAMKALGLKNACVLGVSQGAMVAQYLALEYPDLVGRLVLALSASRVNDTMKQALDKWTALAKKKDYAGIVRDIPERMYSEAYLKRYRIMLPLLAHFYKFTDTQRFIALAEACLSCNCYHQLQNIKCPTLVIGAEQDKVVTGDASREIAEVIGCRLHMYKNLGHAAYEEAKDFNRLVLDFLSE